MIYCVAAMSRGVLRLASALLGRENIGHPIFLRLSDDRMFYNIASMDLGDFCDSDGWRGCHGINFDFQCLFVAG